MSKLLSILSYLGFRLIFVDEYNISSTCTRPYAWTERNRNCSILTEPRARSISCIAGVSKDELLVLQLHDSTINNEIFLAFLDELVATLKEKYVDVEDKFVIIFDNATSHTARRTATWSEDNNIMLLSLAPYSPESNPCELFIRCHKSKIRHELTMGK